MGRIGPILTPLGVAAAVVETMVAKLRSLKTGRKKAERERHQQYFYYVPIV